MLPLASICLLPRNFSPILRGWPLLSSRVLWSSFMFWWVEEFGTPGAVVYQEQDRMTAGLSDVT